MIELSVLIVNYKTGEMTRNCIEQLNISISNRIAYEVIVVDNNSGDDSKNIVLSNLPEVIWISNKENSGFGAGMNLAMKNASGKFFLLLNSDVQVCEGAVEGCLGYIKEHKDIGALGCKIIYPDGKMQKSVWYNVADYREIWNSNLILTKFKQLQGNEIKALMGSFLIIPKSVIEKVGPFDPDFFMYSEEMELCHRIRKAGYRLYFNSNYEVIHEVGASSDENWATRQKQLSNVLLYRKIRGFFSCYLFLFLKTLNALSNFFILWIFPSEVRRSVLRSSKIFFSGLGRYLLIPFIYKRKTGSGKYQLRIQN